MRLPGLPRHDAAIAHDDGAVPDARRLAQHVPRTLGVDLGAEHRVHGRTRLTRVYADELMRRLQERGVVALEDPLDPDRVVVGRCQVLEEVQEALPGLRLGVTGSRVQKYAATMSSAVTTPTP